MGRRNTWEDSGRDNPIRENENGKLIEEENEKRGNTHI